jgi:hypothetical protein
VKSDDVTGTPTSQGASHSLTWADLLAAYRQELTELWSGLLLERLGPWLAVARRYLKPAPPYLGSEDVAQELALEVLRIASRWRPACEDRWIPRRLVERAARRVSEALLRERLASSEELSVELASAEPSEPELAFDTPVGRATAADLRVIYRAKVLGEPVDVLAGEAGVAPGEMRRRLRTARTRARATAKPRANS